MEKFELVDKNGNGTGNILTYVEACNTNNIPDKCYLPAVGVVIVNKHNEILLQKRSRFKKSNPNKWGVCGGKVNLGEDSIDAAVRETFEEIGILLDKDSLKTIRKATNGKYYFTVYYTRKNINLNECKLQEREIDEVRYFKIEELKSLDNEGLEWLDNLKKVI